MMHRFLAFFLAALMVVGVFSAMPTAAEVAVATIDGTTNGNVFKDLIITEILINSKSGTDRDDYVVGESAAVFSSPDALDYIEVYNAGDRPVNIYDYCILSAPYHDFTGESKASGSNTAAVPYKFTYKNVIVAGNIHTEGGAKSDPKNYNNQCVNPAMGNGNYINPGETAVIWYWTAATDTACSDEGYSLGWTDENGRTFAYFRNYYGIDKDTKIFVTNAKTSNAVNYQTGDDWFGSLEYNYVYALAHKNYDETQPAIVPQGVGSKVTLSDTAYRNLRCFASYTTYNRVGIVSTDNMDNVSAYYVPAACTPDLINLNERQFAEYTNTQYIPYVDYVQAGCAFSYRETAIISFVEEPTPGGMPSWQWQYIEQGSSLEHDLDNDVYGYGLAYIDSIVWERAVGKVEDMVDSENLNARLPGITGVPNQLIGAAMDDATQAAKKLELYNQLMDCYVSDWLDIMGTFLNDRIVGENNRLLTTQTDGVYDWVAQTRAFMLEYYTISFDPDADTGYTESKQNYEQGFVSREDLYREWFSPALPPEEGGDGGSGDVGSDTGDDLIPPGNDPGAGDNITPPGGNSTTGDSTTPSDSDTVSGNGGSDDANADKNANADQGGSIAGGTIALIAVGIVLIVVVSVVIVLLIIMKRSRRSGVGEPSVSASKDEYFDNAAVPVVVDISRVMDLAECLRESWAMCKSHPMPTNIAHSMQMTRELHRTIETTSQKEQALNALTPIETMLQMLQSRTELLNDAVAFSSTAASVDGMIENLIKILTALYGDA